MTKITASDTKPAQPSFLSRWEKVIKEQPTTRAASDKALTKALDSLSRIPPGAVTLGEYRRSQRRDAERLDYAGILVEQLRAAGILDAEREYKFHPQRKWRFDVALIAGEFRLGIEIQGGLWSGVADAKRAHAMPLNIMRDYEKHNAAVVLGWKVLYFVPEQIARPDGTWVNDGLSVIERVLKGE